MTMRMSTRAAPSITTTEHVPCVHILINVLIVFSARVVHDLHFPAHREVPRYDLRAFIMMESNKVLDSEERATANVLYNETSATRMELPLQYTPHATASHDQLGTPSLRETTLTC